MGLRKSTKDTAAAWLMSGPSVIGLLLFMVVPFLIAAVLSLTNYRLNSPLPIDWVGFDNYKSLFRGADFPRAILNNMIFTLVVVPVQTALALALALLVNQRLKGMVIFRTLFFMPVIYPMALVSVVWGLIFAPGQSGLMNQLLGTLSFGLWDTSVDFLHNKYFALPCIMLMSIWQGVGFQMVVLLAALQGIPETLYEAARIDRAGKWSRFVHVTLPQLRNGLIFVAMVTTILAFRLFDQVWILTQGGPRNATTTVMFEAYLASKERNQIGLGSAMTVIFFILVGTVAMIQHFGIRQRREVQ
ncbi:MAG: carbohydrate ABC transporter permease [Verrucomicrobiota bacterium]